MDGYNRGGHTKYSLTVHMVFATKLETPDTLVRRIFRLQYRAGLAKDH